MKCNRCDSKKVFHQLRLISSGKPVPMPKYIPQIKSTCYDCNSFIKFSPQTPEIIDAFNQLNDTYQLVEENKKFAELRKPD